MHDPQDPVVAEVPVHFSNALAQKLVLFQYPTLPNDPYFPPNFSMSQRFKPKNRLFEFDIPIETEGNQMYDHETGRELAAQLSTSCNLFDKMTYSSTSLSFESLSYLVGMRRGNKFHLCFLDEIHQMRPSMRYLDEIDSKHSSPQLIDQPPGEEGKAPSADSKVLQVQFRRRETEEEQDARLRSYAHYLKLIQEENWQPLNHFSYRSEESLKIFDKLGTEASSDAMFTEQSLEYFVRNFPSELPAAQQSELQDGALSQLPLCSLASAPLAMRVKVLLSKMRIISTSRVFELLSVSDSVSQSTVLQELEKRAFLIDNRWIVKSEFVLGISKELAHKRNYLLWLFTRDKFVERKMYVEQVKIDNELASRLLSEIADLATIDAKRVWKLKGHREELSTKKYAGIIKRQQELFSEAMQPSVDLILANLKEPLTDNSEAIAAGTGSKRGKKR